jgi:hypothetical protein
MARSRSSYQDLYRDTYAALGYKLARRDGVAGSRIAAAEKKLRVRLPTALRDYYLVAGAEPRFNQFFNRLYAPREWFLDGGKLAFMEESQAVVFWGVNATRWNRRDPTVYQGVNGEPIKWYVEHPRCSVFLTVVLHWHGAYGGAMRCCQTAPLSQKAPDVLRRHWAFVGEVNQMRAYSKPGRAVCALYWTAPPWEGEWRVFAGATTQDGLNTIAEELDLKWDGP